MGAGKSKNFDQAFFHKYTTQKYYLSRGASGHVYGPIHWNDTQLSIKQATFAAGKVTEEFRKDIEIKKEIWTSLKHKNLIRIHLVDLSQLPDVMFIVMDFAAGRSLCETLRSLRSGQKLPIYIVTEWAMQIAEGMLYLHAKNIVHRDLTSSKRELIYLNLLASVNWVLSIIYVITDFYGYQTKWYWTKWYGQNGTDKMVPTFID